MQRKVVGIILAGGKGERTGLPYSKLLYNLDGKSVFQRTLETFLEVDIFSDYVVVLPLDDTQDISQFDSILKEAQTESSRKDLNFIIAQAGKTRRESVRNALNAYIDDYSPDLDKENTYIAIHDAARCFVSNELIEKSINACFEKNAVTLGIPARNSLKKVNSNGEVLESLERSKIWEIQTPQVFRLDLIEKVHTEFEGEEEPTDDASMVEKIAKVYLVKGSSENIKITYQSDLKDLDT